MLDELRSVIEQLKVLAAAFDPKVVEGDAAMRFVAVFAEGERLCAAGKVLAAGRVSDAEVWRRGGWRSMADWIDSQTRAGRSQSTSAVETAERLAGCAAVEAELRAGRMSETQAHAIVAAAAVRPDAEEHLVGFARDHSVRQLLDECRRVKACAASAGDDHERLRRGRSFRHWVGRDGAVCVSGRFTPEAGAPVITAVEHRKAKVAQAARRHGEREPFDAYAADALVELVTEDRGVTAGRSRPEATVVVHVAYEALVRGAAGDGEVCEVSGVGPVPVEVARRLAEDSILRVLVTKGGVPFAVTDGQRTIPPAPRTLLEARDRECVVPGCDVTRGLQIDHRQPFAAGGPTSPENCSRLCARHHDMKTYQGWRLGGRPGAWTWTPPADYLDPPPPDPLVGTLITTDPWTGRIHPDPGHHPQRLDLVGAATSGTVP
ncbi:MAG: DUF222 domain-containing protein [Acidimicrobiia bacterium]